MATISKATSRFRLAILIGIMASLTGLVFWLARGNVQNNAALLHLPVLVVYCFALILLIGHACILGMDSFARQSDAFKFVVRVWTLWAGYFFLYKMEPVRSTLLLIPCVIGFSLLGVAWFTIRDKRRKAMEHKDQTAQARNFS